MTPEQAMQYLSQVASDYLQTLPLSARQGTVEKINEAFITINKDYEPTNNESKED